jgi:D-beta-D-heptose 7-phosphate kinase / D-beta-D-heptose 1-phosphate adenosyltransferase
MVSLTATDGEASPLMGAVGRLGSSRPSVLVVGDVMLDRYLHCDSTERDNPENPGRKIRRFRDCEDHLGGAGAVAAMCAGLGANVYLVGRVGNDRAGLAVRNMLDTAGIEYRLCDAVARATTLKLRIVCGDQLERIDRDAIDGETAEHDREPWTWAAGLVAMGHVQAVLIADYGKGFCQVRELRRLLFTATMTGVPTLVDPARGLADWDRYRGAWLMKANLSEYRGLSRAGREEAWLTFRRIVVTAGARGMFLRRGERGFRVFRTEARHAVDACGAGDQVLAALGCATAAGVSLETACELANRAAGVSVMRRGAKPVLLDELRAAIV